jgi:hypothetical protein
MPKHIRLLAISMISISLFGCATPRYETRYRYEPPASSEGVSCIKNCDGILSSCRSQCRTTWLACTAHVETQLETRYVQALKEYAGNLQHYRLELEQYELSRWMDWNQGFDGYWRSPWPYHPWSGYIPMPLSPGDPPTRESVRESLYKSQCKDDCGCQVKFDTCYTGCGGHILHDTRRLE